MDFGNSALPFSFRARMTVVLTILLLLTLATLQYQSQRAQREVEHELDMQEQSVRETIDAQLNDIIAAANVGIWSLTDNRYLYEQIDEKYAGIVNRDRIRHILIVLDSGEIEDATEKAVRGERIVLPEEAGTGDALPRALALHGDPLASLPGRENEGPADTYWFRPRTTSGGRWIAVVVSTAEVSYAILESQQRLAEVVDDTSRARLQTTVVVFALALLLMVLLVWRFTRPIRKLSDAAVRVACGDLDFKVDIKRRDEIGQLARTFDQMIDGLKAKSELEERLNNTERAAVIGRLTGAIAHEIRNPLNFINLSIDHVRSKYAPDEGRGRARFDQLLGSIKDETARLNRLVTDVLNFGRPANFNARPVDLRDVVEQTIQLVRAQADEQGVEIDAHLPDEPATVNADAEKIKSCFSNLVINAVQAMGEAGGKLRIEMERTPEGYRTRFADTGPGIPEDALDRIFEPYYSTKDTGTGLGLAVTKKIVEEHNGRVAATSRTGEGTEFVVELPFDGPGATARASAPSAATVRDKSDAPTLVSGR